MMPYETAVAELRREAEEDYVGLWEIFRLLRRKSDAGHAASVEALQADVLQIVSTLLSDPDMEIGQFHGGEFHPWAGNSHIRLEHLASALRQLNRDPDIGEIAWLVKR